MSVRSRVFMFRVAFFATAVVIGRGIPTAYAQPAFFMGLGDLPGGDFYSGANDVSADGSIVVGYSRVGVGAGAIEAFRWTRNTGMVGLGTLGKATTATRISDDGSTIIGSYGMLWVEDP